jgi:hypothetical protein
MSRTIKQAAAELLCRQHHVLALGRSGQLRMVNIALNPNGKKKWLILDDDWEAFLDRRRLQVAGPRHRKRKPNRNVVQYF